MIELKNISKVYPDNQVAVKDLSLTVNEGETVVLIGASGCGKTTTLKMINRLIEPTSGEIWIKGENALKLNPVNLRREMGYVIQKIGLFPHMTIGENVGLVPALLGWPEEKKRKRVHELMGLVRLTPDVYANRFPHELSGGQQQRIGVARALAVDPPILLMDEPFGALDPITRRELQEEFQNLKRQIRKTIVFVTHDIIEAVTLGDRIAVLNKGKLIQLGPPKEILDNPANPMVETIIGHQLFQLTLSSKTIQEAIETSPLAATMEILATPVQSVMSYMREQEIEILPVVDQDQHFLRTITLDNLSKAKSDMKVEKIVSPFPHSIANDTSLLAALNTMMEKNAEAVPVTDRDGKLQGILCREKLLQVVNRTLDKGRPSDSSD